MDTQKLYSIIDSYKDDIVEMLRRWISIPSVGAERSGENAPFGPEVRRMLDTALNDAAQLGFKTREFDGYVMDAQLGGGEQTMGMLCHLDVVPAGDGWTHAPFGGEIEDGKLFGRGTIDDKGCGVLALFAMKAVREAGIPLRHGVRLILGCDEETGMQDMRHYAKCADLPDYGFSPDAEFPVINIEKGSMGIQLSALSEGEEGADIPVYELYAGERANVVPGTAKAIIGADVSDKLAQVRGETGFDLKLTALEGGRYELLATGQQAHASMPHLGKNAAGMLLIALSKLNAGGGIQGAIRVLAEKLGIEGYGESLGLACEDAESGRLTCNLGLLRFDGRVLTAFLDCRTPICANHAELCGRAVKQLEGTPVSFSLARSRTYHYIPAEHRVVKGLLKAYSEVTGSEGYAFAIGGGTYSRHIPCTVAFGPNFPGDIDMCHMPDEYIEIDKMMKCVKIFARAIVELAGA